MINYLQQKTQPVSNRITTTNVELPNVYRVVKIVRELLASDLILNVAEFYHEKASFSASWTSENIDKEITVGVLVNPTWDISQACSGGNIRIKSASVMSLPSEDFNLFETLPYEWIQNRVLVSEAKPIIDGLSPHFRLLFTAIFWDWRRFYRFINGPSSLNGHHNSKHGNLRHTIEVATLATKLADNNQFVSNDVLIIAALLHDAGKADEYKRNLRRDCFELSARGALIGHKMTIVEWITSAIALYKINIPSNEYLGLMHCLTAVKGAPEWIGLREPMSPECTLLSMADRLSGQNDLLLQTMPSSVGFGKYHKHLRGRPFLINANPNSRN